MSWYGICKCGHHVEGHQLVAGVPFACRVECCTCAQYQDAPTACAEKRQAPVTRDEALEGFAAWWAT